MEKFEWYHLVFTIIIIFQNSQNHNNERESRFFLYWYNISQTLVFILCYFVRMRCNNYLICRKQSKRGSVTRLLTAGTFVPPNITAVVCVRCIDRVRCIAIAHGDHLMNEINTFVAKPPVEYMAHDGYVCLTTV